MKKIFLYGLPFFLLTFFSSCEKDVFSDPKKQNLVDYYKVFLDSKYVGKYKFSYDNKSQVEQISVFDQNNLPGWRMTFGRNSQNKNLEIKFFNVQGMEELSGHLIVFATNKIDSIIESDGYKYIYNYQNLKLVSITHISSDGSQSTEDYVGKNSSYLKTTYNDNHDFVEFDRGFGLLANTIDRGLIEKTSHPGLTINYLYILEKDRVKEKESIYTNPDNQKTSSIKNVYFYKK